MQSCWWKLPGRSLKVYLHLTVIEHIRQEIRLAFPCEVGGILLGCIERGAEPHIVVMDCLPVHCEHKFGNLYQFCEFDQLRLEKQVSSWRAVPGKLLYVVGCYRSHNRPGFDLAPEDLAIAGECASELGSLFMLIQASTQQHAGGLFFVEDGSRTRGCEILFPFDAGVLLTLDVIFRDRGHSIHSGHGGLPDVGDGRSVVSLRADVCADTLQLAGKVLPGLSQQSLAYASSRQIQHFRAGFAGRPSMAGSTGCSFSNPLADALPWQAARGTVSSTQDVPIQFPIDACRADVRSFEPFSTHRNADDAESTT